MSLPGRSGSEARRSATAIGWAGARPWGASLARAVTASPEQPRPRRRHQRCRHGRPWGLPARAAPWRLRGCSWIVLWRNRNRPRFWRLRRTGRPHLGMCVSTPRSGWTLGRSDCAPRHMLRVRRIWLLARLTRCARRRSTGRPRRCGRISLSCATWCCARVSKRGGRRGASFAWGLCPVGGVSRRRGPAGIAAWVGRRRRAPATGRPAPASAGRTAPGRPTGG